MNPRILVINPGSTSTKIAVFAGECPLFEETIRHDDAELERFDRIMDQEDYRRDLILAALDRHGLQVADLTAIIGRGGLLRPIPGGVYAVNETMLTDLRSCHFGSHASNLGAILAHDLAQTAGLPSFVADPVVVDELCPLARYSGHPDIRRRSIFHALNHKAVARRAARDLGQACQDLRLVIAHLGGGISVGAHQGGRVIDVNNALDGDGPFSPERSGGLPAGQVVDWCFALGADETDIRRRITGQGGLRAYLGTASGPEIRNRIENGDGAAEEAMEAMAYQVAKDIGAMAAVLSGQVDAVILTGGLAHDQNLVHLIATRVRFVAQILTYPGENELEALALGALRCLQGDEDILIYG